MIRAAALAFVLAATPVAAQDMQAEAIAAAAALQLAVAEMDKATTARDRVAALTRTIKAYEQGLAVLRTNLRQVKVREASLLLQFQSERARIAQLLGVLGQMEATPAPLLLLHPSGPLGTARSGMLLREATPALQREADRLGAELRELQDLRRLQATAAETLSAGLGSAQAARTALSQAVSERTTLPRRFTEDPAALKALLESADTLEGFASGLSLDPQPQTGPRDFAAARGTLPLPALGTLLRRAGEADATGQRRPGLSLATRPHALVSAPWPGTIRYRGPLLDYGNVMILEPGNGYLVVLAGLAAVYGEVGEVIGAGAPLGLMGPETTAEAEFLAAATETGDAQGSETLYIEIRNGTEPEDPAPWFALTKE